MLRMIKQFVLAGGLLAAALAPAATFVDPA